MAKKYNAIIIGAGISGLSTAIAYAKKTNVAKNPILVLEKEPKVGGMVTSFKRDGYLFDTVQMITDVSKQLEYLGIDLPLKRFEGYAARIFIANPETGTARRIDIPSSTEAFKSMLLANYGADGKSAARLVDYSARMFNEMAHLRLNGSLWGNLTMLFRCRRVISNANLTFLEYMNRFHITNPELRDVFEIFAAMTGLPAERGAALFAAGAMTSMLEGCYRPHKGFIKLPHMMRKRAEELGATIQCRTKVQRILTENGKIKGIITAEGELIEANHVVIAMDTKAALFSLLGDDVLRAADPTYADRAQKVKMSPSSITISLGLDDKIDLAAMGMDCGYNIITTGGDTFDKLFQAYDAGKEGFTETCFHTAAICPSITTGTKNSLVIRVLPMPLNDWVTLREKDPMAYEAKKQRIADFYISRVAQYLIPDLQSHIELVDISTPATFVRYAGTPTGSIYDMSAYPDNFGRKRLPMVTPIKGLILPKYGHSIYCACQAGFYAADYMLSKAR